MIRLPEGIRRICVVVGVCLVLASLWGWGEERSGWMSLSASHVVFRLAFLAFAYFSPFLVCMIIFWIKAGFEKQSSR
ncbi:hypothetical protein [Pseudomonas guariconensis]|uniref:hypothetical protein n=1 Tax=Pseudomonas guariconensis TaxID=1288410 RepID=UPI002F403A3C